MPDKKRNRGRSVVNRGVTTGKALLWTLILSWGIVSSLVVSWRAWAESDPFARRRKNMVEQQIISRGVTDQKVLAALFKVERHRFVDAERQPLAYTDRPLPIGYGQTISQPYIVAVMSELLQLSEEAMVLEIGTGSGYQTAILAEMVKAVYSLEIVEPLAEQARQRLRELGYKNVTIRAGDGYYGWPEHGPYDAIIVTAAASHIPPPLIEQLKPGARMVIPVGPPLQTQYLMLVEKRQDGTVVQRNTMPVRFVPLTGEH